MVDTDRNRYYHLLSEYWASSSGKTRLGSSSLVLAHLMMYNSLVKDLLLVLDTTS